MSSNMTRSAAIGQSATSLVLLCGLLCDFTIWAAVARRLNSNQVQIESFPASNSIGAMARGVLQRAPEKFALGGHSMGGRVALEVVRQAPDRVLALGLFNTGIHPCKPGEPEARARLLRIAREQGMSALAAEWLPPMMGAPPLRRLEVMPELTRMVERMSLSTFEGQIKALLDRPDARPVLRTITVPTLLASATSDTWSPVSQHEDMLREIPHARLAVIEAAGHMMPIEQPDALAREINVWMEGLPA